MAEPLEIGICLDGGYGLAARALIESLARYSGSPGLRLHALVADEDAEEAVRTSPAVLSGRVGLRVLRAQVPAEWQRSADSRLAYISPAMYLRLGLPSRLSPDVRRLLYLDCDVLCVGSLAGLATVDLANAILAAVPDPGVGRPGYFNSGVLLIDVDRWIEERVGQRALAFTRAHAGHLTYPDQDALNAVLQGRWQPLDRAYNELEAWELDHPGAAVPTGLALVHCAGTIKFWHDDFPSGFRRTTFWECAGRPADSSTATPDGEPSRRPPYRAQE